MQRWIARSLIGLATVLWLAAAFVYLKSNEVLTRQYDHETREVALSTQPAVLEEGERLARLLGCFEGCHNDRMQGSVTRESPLFGSLYAPNLTQSVQLMTLPEIDALVRQGVRPDGTSVFGMPSASFSALTDNDFQAVISFIEQYPQQSGQRRRSDYGLLARYEIMAGKLPAQADIRRHYPWPETFRADEARLGEYLYTVTCSQCHGEGLSLGAASAASMEMIPDYNRFEFGRLLELGVGVDGKESGEMTRLARKRYQHLTEAEVSAMYLYLKTSAAEEPTN